MLNIPVDPNLLPWLLGAGAVVLGFWAWAGRGMLRK